MASLLHLLFCYCEIAMMSDLPSHLKYYFIIISTVGVVSMVFSAHYKIEMVWIAILALVLESIYCPILSDILLSATTVWVMRVDGKYISWQMFIYYSTSYYSTSYYSTSYYSTSYYSTSYHSTIIQIIATSLWTTVLHCLHVSILSSSWRSCVIIWSRQCNDEPSVGWYIRVCCKEAVCLSVSATRAVCGSIYTHVFSIERWAVTAVPDVSLIGLRRTSSPSK